MKFFIFALSIAAGIQSTSALSADGAPFDLIQAGDYGSSKFICGMNIAKNTSYSKLVVEYIANPMQKDQECDDAGIVHTFACDPVACVAYSDERRKKWVIGKSDILDDGNFVRTFYAYDFRMKEYIERERTKFRKQ